MVLILLVLILAILFTNPRVGYYHDFGYGPNGVLTLLLVVLLLLMIFRALPWWW